MKPRIALVVLAALALAARQLAAEPATDAADPFAGKIVVIYSAAARGTGSLSLREVHLRKVEGRNFIVGTGVENKQSNNWTNGLRFSVAWETVTSYIEFTPDEFEKFCKEYQE